MAATLNDIVTRAFRRSGIVAVGVTPDTPEASEGLTDLTDIIVNLFGYEMGENLQEYNYGSYGLTNPDAIAQDCSSVLSQTIPINSQIVFNVNTPTTIYLPSKPYDGSRFNVIDNAGTFGTTAPLTIKGSGRKIQDPVSFSNGSQAVLTIPGGGWIYRKDLGTWIVVQLGSSNNSPFASIFDPLLVDLLALRLGTRYGAEISPELVDSIAKMSKKFRAHYRQKTEVSSENSLLYLSSFPPYSSTNFVKGLP